MVVIKSVHINTKAVVELVYIPTPSLYPPSPPPPTPSLLNKHQVYEEVDRVMGNCTQPTLEQYMQLKYCMRCVNESMRLYPHPPVLLRRALVDDTLPGVVLL